VPFVFPVSRGIKHSRHGRCWYPIRNAYGRK
jgi:hypothetical protein